MWQCRLKFSSIPLYFLKERGTEGVSFVMIMDLIFFTTLHLPVTHTLTPSLPRREGEELKASYRLRG